jgi:hypothetical protein
MDNLDDLTKINNSKTGFFKHVFNFNDNSKAELLNIVQYSVLAIIPVVILNKLMQRYVPEAEENKNSLELSFEVLAQIIIMFITILFIHRMVTYIPTYSGEKYAEFSVTNIIIAMLVILLSLQTKLGEKVSILVDRIIELWEGPKTNNNKKNNIKITQPISQNQNQIAMQNSLNSMGSTSISALPSPPLTIPNQPNQSQNLPDYNAMYQKDSNPLVNANSPGMENMEPMAANSMGGGSFGSAFGW